jgi:predicted peptidase
MLDYLGTAPEEAGVAVLAPNSRGNTWDAISDGSFGPDVKFLNRALELVIEKLGMLPIDASRIVIGGFSEGASYEFRGTRYRTASDSERDQGSSWAIQRYPQKL